MMALPNQSQLAISSGRDVNCHGRIYKRGASYSVDIKLEVANTYQELVSQCPSGRPNLSHIAKLRKVDRSFVKKIEDEIWAHNRILPPDELRINQDRPVGPGSISLSQIDMYIILMLHH